MKELSDGAIGDHLCSRLHVLSDAALNMGNPSLDMILKEPSEDMTPYGVVYSPFSLTFPTSMPRVVALMMVDRASMAPCESTLASIFTVKSSAVCFTSVFVE